MEIPGSILLPSSPSAVLVSTATCVCTVKPSLSVPFRAWMACRLATLKSHKILPKISTRITNTVKGAVNRVVYDITHKPPGTIEWE